MKPFETNNYSSIKIYPSGDIDLCYKGEYFELIDNRAYRLTDAVSISTPAGKLVKKRISNKLFEEIKTKVEEILNQ